MKGLRVQAGVDRPAAFVVDVDGELVTAHGGEILAAVLLVAGKVSCYRSRGGQLRGPFCNMGSCYECLLSVESPSRPARRWLRACVTLAEPDMRIRTGQRWQEAFQGES